MDAFEKQVQTLESVHPLISKCTDKLVEITRLLFIFFTRLSVCGNQRKNTYSYLKYYFKIKLTVRSLIPLLMSLRRLFRPPPLPPLGLSVGSTFLSCVPPWIWESKFPLPDDGGGGGGPPPCIIGGGGGGAGAPGGGGGGGGAPPIEGGGARGAPLEGGGGGPPRDGGGGGADPKPLEGGGGGG